MPTFAQDAFQRFVREGLSRHQLRVAALAVGQDEQAARPQRTNSWSTARIHHELQRLETAHRIKRVVGEGQGLGSLVHQRDAIAVRRQLRQQPTASCG